MLLQTEIITMDTMLEEGTKATSSAGIETSLANYASTAQEEAVQPHRALIFCQMSSFLELVC